MMVCGLIVGDFEWRFVDEAGLDFDDGLGSRLMVARTILVSLALEPNDFDCDVVG